MPDKQYQKISIACSHDIVEAFSNFLLERNTGGVVSENNVIGDRIILTAYIDPDKTKPLYSEEIDSYFESIKEFFDNPKYEIISLEYIKAEDWMAAWKETFHPIHVTERIVVRPTWESYEPQAGEVVIVIDPKMAFGTGHHETTAQCMLGLEMLRPIDQRILDYGCGTGLLAIAAAKMGAAEVIAIDNDSEAIACARENFALNDVKIELIESADYIADPPVDIITANLNIGIIIEMYDKLDASLKSSGHIIFSGIPIEDRQRMLDFISDKPYDIIQKLADTEWVSYIAVKR